MGNYAKPRALTENEIRDFIDRFAKVAVIARETGFTGVQIHGAHGYLISAFLSPVTNRRTDAWGGSLPNRARFLLETVRAVRKAVGDDFPVGIKLNSDDFRKGGFSNADCLEVVGLLNAESVDLLEISGGNYEQPRLLGVSGREQDAVAVRPSTRIREAYFLEYAEAIKTRGTHALDGDRRFPVARRHGGGITQRGLRDDRYRAALMHAYPCGAGPVAGQHRWVAGL